MTSRTEATVRNELGREYACIENIDEQVGLVLEKLRKMGELENTFAFLHRRSWNRCGSAWPDGEAEFV